MARSSIIKDLANGKVDTMVALKRAKVLLSDFEDEAILNWINYELIGYPDDVELPDYRKTRGNIFGSYYKGSMASHVTFTNISLPLGNMPEDLQDSLLTIQFRESVDSLYKLLEDSTTKKGQLGKIVPADLFPSLALFNQDPYMIITSARVVFDAQSIKRIFAAIENRLLDILILLEKEFGNLDELDLDCSSKSEDDIKMISDRIAVIIYNDMRVTIGDNNKIKDSKIASSTSDT